MLQRYRQVALTMLDNTTKNLENTVKNLEKHEIGAFRGEISEK